MRNDHFIVSIQYIFKKETKRTEVDTSISYIDSEKKSSDFYFDYIYVDYYYFGDLTLLSSHFHRHGTCSNSLCYHCYMKSRRLQMTFYTSTSFLLTTFHYLYSIASCMQPYLISKQNNCLLYFILFYNTKNCCNTIFSIVVISFVRLN